MDRQNSKAAASEDTLASLQQLEPSPIESPFDLDKQLPDLPATPPIQRSSSLGLSGSGHGAVYYLTRLQRYSSYTFAIFTAFHITNTSLIPLLTRSVPDSETYLLLTRPYYQSPFLEPLLITIPLAVHILSGFALRLHRRNAAIRRFDLSNTTISQRFSQRIRIWPQISYTSIAGYVLVPLVFGHAFVNRILPLWVEGSSSGVGLGFVSHGFAKHPVVSSVGYATLVVVAAGHIVWGWAKWMGLAPEGSATLVGKSGKRARRRWIAVNGVAALVTGIWMAGGLGVIGRGGRATGWVGKGWDALYARIPLLKL